jgi:histidine triad (HIT) family protein
MMSAFGHYDAPVTTDCLFCKIVAGEIPSTVVHETDLTLAFRDINPQAPTHVVVIPKAHHTDAASLGEADPALAGSLLAAAGAVAQAEGIAESGYRLVFNKGRGAGQTVFHVHCHVLGGRRMTWPPG